MAAKQWTRRVVNCRVAVIVLIWRVSFVGESEDYFPPLRPLASQLVCQHHIAVGNTGYCSSQSFHIIFPLIFHTAIKQNKHMLFLFHIVIHKLTVKYDCCTHFQCFKTVFMSDFTIPTLASLHASYFNFICILFTLVGCLALLNPTLSNMEIKW